MEIEDSSKVRRVVGSVELKRAEGVGSQVKVSVPALLAHMSLMPKLLHFDL